MNHQAFFDSIRPLFGKMSAQQVAGTESILAASETLHITHRAYLLATAFHETGTRMQPIKETVQAYHKNANPSDEEVVKRLDVAWKKGLMPQVKTAYWRFDTEGKAWFGRGLVQITHKSPNYVRAAQALGVDLLGNPNLALQPTVAAQILVRGCSEGWFGAKLSTYLPGNYVGARHCVNGTDKAAQIAGYAMKFETALIAGGAAKPATTPAQAPKPIPVTLPAQTPKAARGGVPAQIVALLAAAIAAAWYWFTK